MNAVTEPALNLSVIVCCYNSASRLQTTLAHLAVQRTDPGLRWEIILVDNNSTDQTASAAQTIWQSFKSAVPFQVVFEPKPGLANARMKGFEVSKGEFLLFCDDDNWLDENYVNLCCAIMKSDDKIAMLGGIGEAVSDVAFPDWFEELKISYAVGPQAAKDGDITFEKGFVYGAGSVVRKAALQAVYAKGFEHVLTDRIGKVLVSGGDNEMGYALALSGWKIHYSSQLRFRHFLPAGRLNRQYLQRLAKGQMLTYFKINAYESRLFGKASALPDSRFSKSVAHFKQFIRYVFDLLRGKLSYFRFCLRINRLFYGQYYLLVHYNDFKQDIARVKHNINLLQ